MPSRIIKRYFDVVPVFRFKEIELKERLTLIFYITGFCLSVVAFITTLFLDMPFWVNIPNLLLMMMCLFLPFMFRKEFAKIAVIMVFFVAFLYLPLTYFINGGHHGIGTMYFLMMVIYFTFYFEGKKLYKILIVLLSYYSILIIAGYNFPVLITPYSDDLSRLIDIIVSLISISIVLAVLSHVIFISYRIEKDNNLYLLKELEDRNKQLELLSTIDQLTDVYNRRYFMEILEKEFEYYKESKKHFYVMMIDLDDFKLINDTYGHLYGDEVLKKVAKGIKSCLRDHDVVSRYGGEEFSIIISHLNEENGNDIAERIRKTVESIKYRNKTNVTISIGVVKNVKGDTLLGIMKRADEYLYIAKEKGKNKVEGK